LTSHQYTVKVYNANVSATGNGEETLFPNTQDIAISYVRVHTFVATTNDGTNNWTIVFRLLNLDRTGTTTALTVNTGTTPDAPNTYNNHSAAVSVVEATNKFSCGASMTKNNAPGNLYIWVTATFRLVAP
jgi:hypothetical protein